MIKIPKNLDELKQIVSETSVNEMIDRVKTTISNVTDVSKSKDSATADGSAATGLALIAKLRSLQKEQQVCINDLERYVQNLEKQFASVPAQTHSEVKEQALAADAVADDSKKDEVDRK